MGPSLTKPNLPDTFAHRPQLDGLRAFAVAAVLVHHFLPKLGPLSYGVLGVRLFFVLSGFLITSILLGCRDIAGQTGSGRLHQARQFYARRFLRIFPLYYFVVALAAALNLEQVRDLIGWLLTYSLNIQMSLTQQWPANISHFWSLAVEEQFYILWPWFILFAPRRWLLPGTLLVILCGPLYRFWAVAHQDNWVAVYTLTPALADTLGCGALLALLGHSRSLHQSRHLLAKLGLPLALSTLVLLELLIRQPLPHAANTYAVCYDLALALLFFWLVDGAARGFRGIPGRILQSPPIAYLGKISYGIYVYHAFTPDLASWFCRQFKCSFPTQGWLHFLLLSLLSVALAALSWQLFEAPLNRLKRFFPYHTPRTTTNTSPALSTPETSGQLGVQS